MDGNHSRRGVRRAVAWLSVGALVAAGRRLGRVEVLGDSMRPALEPGDRLLVVRGLPARPGDVVALRDPRRPERTMVKRIAAGPGQVATGPDGRALAAGAGYVVLGDNPAATTDSSHFGAVEPGGIIGPAVYRYAPDARRGWLASPRVDIVVRARALRRLLEAKASQRLPIAKPRR